MVHTILLPLLCVLHELIAWNIRQLEVVWGDGHIVGFDSERPLS